MLIIGCSENQPAPALGKMVLESRLYEGDVAGAWRALDEDLSGYITLQVGQRFL